MGDRLRATVRPQKLVEVEGTLPGRAGGLSLEEGNMLGCGTGTGGEKEEEAARQVGATDTFK